jgi:hypothetical protein
MAMHTFKAIDGKALIDPIAHGEPCFSGVAIFAAPK